MRGAVLGLTSRWRRGDGGDADAFAGAVREACTRLGLVVVQLQGDLVVLQGRITGTVALEDVRAACLLRPGREWPRVVLDALQGLATAVEAGSALGALDDEAALRPRLRTRVQTEGAVLADDVVRRPLAAGLVEVLVADLAGAVRPVPPSSVRSWGADPDELLDLGRRQVLDDGLLSRRTVDEGAAVVALESPSAFAATHVHWLATYLDPPPAGLLVALPTRHLLLAAPLLGRDQALDAAQTLLVNADALWRAGPGALAPDLWWWRDGALTLLPGTPSSLSPPGEFVVVLEALPG